MSQEMYFYLDNDASYDLLHRREGHPNNNIHLFLSNKK